MKALSAHLLVTHLDLSYNTITDEGITFLAEYLKARLTHTATFGMFTHTHTHTHTHTGSELFSADTEPQLQ